MASNPTSTSRTPARSRKPAPTPPAATTLILVRHGTTATTGTVLPGRAKGLHLSDTGKAQAEHAAARLAPLGIAALYTSPLERTRETARPIAAATGLKAKPSRGLLECDFGDWTGSKLSELRKLPEWQTVTQLPSRFRFPNGESFPEMQQRIVATLDDIAAKHPGQRVVVVSHADPIKAAVAAYAGNHLDLFQRIVISPCSLTTLVVGSGTPIVLGVNNTGDDLGLAPS
jgi:probable phosphoglycerate mutase